MRASAPTSCGSSSSCQEVGLPADHVHDAAEWIEHYLSEDKMGELDELLAEDAAGGKARSPA